jgi:hypothetical protein
MNTEPFSADEIVVELEPQATADSLTEEKQLAAEQLHAVMLKEIRSWRWWLLGTGAVSLVASAFLSASWGVLLIAVGLASFLFKDAAMFVVFGVTMAWAAVTNTIAGIGGQEWGWVIFGILQVYLAVRVFMNYVRFKRAQADWVAMAGESGASRPGTAGIDQAFPVVGCALGALALFGVVAFFIALVVVFGMLEAKEAPRAFGFGLELVVDVGVLAFAVSLASLLSRFRLKVLSILGVVGSAAVLVLYLLMSVAG